MSDEKPVLRDFSLLDLVPAALLIKELPIRSAVGMCEYASETTGREWVGLAYTTQGAFVLPSLAHCFNSTDKESGVPTNLIEIAYEIRLWQVNCGVDDEGLLANELRWANGIGAMDVKLRRASEDLRDGGCWYRTNEYLQHGQPLEGKTMTSVEVFTQGEYGNTVFADELMTGRWA